MSKSLTSVFVVTLEGLPLKHKDDATAEREYDIEGIILDGMGFPDHIEVKVKWVSDKEVVTDETKRA